MKKIMSMVFLFLLVWGSLPQLSPAREDRTDTVRHYILLLDATSSLRSAIKNRNYFYYIEKMLYKRPTQEYLPYRHGRDIVSIVFFHFPHEYGKICKKGLHTSRSLAMIQKGGIRGNRATINSYVQAHRSQFQKDAHSPIGLSEVTVFPFLNCYIKSEGISFEQRVETIYLISLSDEKYTVEASGVKGSLTSFNDDSLKNYYSDLRKNMKQFFPQTELGSISVSVPQSDKKVFFHYFRIEPKLEGISLKLTNKVALARAAEKEGNSGKPKMIWSGSNNICLENNTQYTAWVEWALPPADDEPWSWHDCMIKPAANRKDLTVLSAGCSDRCKDAASKTRPLVKLVKEDKPVWNPNEDAKRFNKIIWYRGAIDLPILDYRYAYPFKTRLYLEPKSVEYVSNEVTSSGEGKVPYYYKYDCSWYAPSNLWAFFSSNIENEVIEDTLIKEKLADPSFLAVVQHYIRDEKLPKQFKEYCDTFRDQTITQLPAQVLSVASNLHALETENKAKWRTLIIYLLLIGVVLFAYFFYLRPMIISFNVDPVTIKNNTIVLDFSSDIRKKEALASIEMENLVYSLHPKKKDPCFKVSFDIAFDFTADPSLEPIYERDRLFFIMDKINKREIPLTSSGKSFYATLPDARFNGKFHLLIDLSRVKDAKADRIGDKLVPFTLTLTSPGARTGSGKKMVINKMKIGSDIKIKKEWQYSGALLLKPEAENREILFKPTLAISNPKATATGAANDNYTLNYSAKRPMLKLFEVEINNNNKFEFSYPVEGRFSFNTRGTKGQTIDNIFHLSTNPLASPDTGPFIDEFPVLLKKMEVRKQLYLYINFDDFPNPPDHNDYAVNCYFDGEIIKTFHFRINRSTEESEALVQLVDEGNSLAMETTVDIVGDNCLLVHKGTKGPIPVSIDIPAQFDKEKKKWKAIKEGKDSPLFTLHLSNNCCTKTGYYKWKLKDISISGDSNVEFTGNPVKLLSSGKTGKAGKITDVKGSKQEIGFCIDHKKIKKVHMYHFSFELTFSLVIRLITDGDPAGVPAGGEKQLDFKINFLCFHDVKDNYLVIDFGTSAICSYFYTSFPDTAGDNYRRIPLQSPDKKHLENKDDLLPSIINLRNVPRLGKYDDIFVKEEDDIAKLAVAGSEHFVDLPARKEALGTCPEIVLNSIKLLIVQGMKIVPVPSEVSFGTYEEKKAFRFMNEEGSTQTGNPALGSVLKSCYENLLKNYIDGNNLGYRKVILTYPNIYNFSHISFLEENVFRKVFQESGRVYFEDIGKESESNSVLYYYLMKRDQDTVPDSENVLVIDIGAGTLDMSLAHVVWKKTTVGAITPKKIEILKRDGIAMAGDTLDKAIALQVHYLLKLFLGAEGFEYSNRIVGTGEAEEKFKLKFPMFEFKMEHILDFKKSMAAKKNDEYVEICLGDNDKIKGLCEMEKEFHEVTLNDGHDQLIPVTLRNEIKLYLGMRKEEWLNLPFLNRFKYLMIQKLKAFAKEIKLPADLNIVLSGRTSLWPSIPQAVTAVFKGGKTKIVDNIWDRNVGKKAVELKKAVILGAIQKATTWNSVKFKEAAVAGAEAVRYQRDPDGSKADSLRVDTFKQNSDPSVTIDLSNSSYFELGIKTSMDFVRFMGGDSYRRDDYCKENHEVTISLEKFPDNSGYYFYVKSDKYPKGKGVRLQHVLSHEAAFLNCRARYWPVRDVQLRETEAEQFNENV